MKQSDEKGLLKKVTFNLIPEVSEGICNVKSQGSRKRAFQEEASVLTEVPRQGTKKGQCGWSPVNKGQSDGGGG